MHTSAFGFARSFRAARCRVPAAACPHTAAWSAAGPADFDEEEDDKDEEDDEEEQEQEDEEGDDVDTRRRKSLDAPHSVYTVCTSTHLAVLAGLDRREQRDLPLNMFCQYIYLWMYVIPAADL